MRIRLKKLGHTVQMIVNGQVDYGLTSHVDPERIDSTVFTSLLKALFHLIKVDLSYTPDL